MEKDYIMSIDVGTQSVRAMVFTNDGENVATERILTEPHYSLQPGWAELPAPSVWENVCTVCNALCKSMGDDINRVAACSITANRDNIIPLDENGEYIRDWITWVDQRRAPEAVFEAKHKWGGTKKLAYLFERGVMEFILARSKFNWFKYHEPETWNSTAKYLTMGGLITYKLTGEFADSLGMQSGVIPFDTKKLEYYKLDLIYQAMGVRRDQLADNLYPPGEKMGEVTKKAALESGLPEGLPIISAGGDKQCEVLGSGAFSEDTAVISYGTLATISVTSKKYVADKKFSFYTFPSSIRNMYYEEFLIDRGYWLVTWFCNQYAAEADFPEFLQNINEKAAKIPPGSDGLFIFPFWAPHYVVYPEAKGCIMGFTDTHLPEHIYRAILESIAYSLKMGYGKIRKKTKKDIRELIIVGGGSQSDVAMQLTADIFNVPATRLKTKEVCGQGAAIPAGIYASFYEDEKDGVEHMLKVDKVFEPIPQNVKVYEDIYKNVYLKMYETNLEIFRKLDKYSKSETKDE